MQYTYQTSIHDVTSNNASSSLREKVILTHSYLFGAKICRKICQGTPGRTILSSEMCVYSPCCVGGEGPCGMREGCGGITVDGELACPVVPHLKWVADGTCQGFCCGCGCDRRLSNVPCTCPQRSYLSHQYIELCIPDGHNCT